MAIVLFLFGVSRGRALAADASQTGAAPPVVPVPSGSPASPAPSESGGAPPPAPVPAPSRQAPANAPPRSAIREPAPRPEAAVRVQQRFALKAKLVQIFGGAEYLSRGDFYNSPGLRIGATYYVLEALGLEAQLAYDWSSLDSTAEQVKTDTGLLPDSRAPGWRTMVGARYSIGYGKLMVGGLGGVVHFEPQAFLHAGIHDNDHQIGPSTDAGLGFLVFLTPKFFARVDAAVTLDFESRSGTTIGVWGALPALSLGGTL
jgi:outer membrane beta-barrel protein